MDYIPKPDADFYNYLKLFCTYIHTNYLALGLTLDQNTALQALFLQFETAYNAQLSAINTAEQATQVKVAMRKLMEAMVRELVKIIQANTAVTNEQKAALGITIAKETRTPAPVPTTRPMAEIDNRNRMQHIINFFDEATPTSKAKPFGVRGCEIWEKIGGTAPVDASELTYVATDGKTPYVNIFHGEDAGKVVHYMLRWINTRGEVGPWSETISVTISA